MALNWFSPLPPEKTDIAHYTARILPALRERFSIRLWTTQGHVTPELEALAPVHRYEPPSPPWHVLNQCECNVYHIGNDYNFHSAIWGVSRQSPGVVVLHDECLQDFFLAHFVGRQNDIAGYERQMARIYGSAGSAVVAEYFAGRCTIDELAAQFPLTQLALENCVGAVVHSRALLDRMATRTFAPCAYAPLPYAAAAPEEQRRWLRLRSQKPRAPIQLAVFGHLGTNRRLPQILEALAGHPDRQRFRLDIYGTLCDANAIVRQADRLGLAPYVHLHGYVPDLDGALATVSLVFNLRYPTMGEASGSQLRIWDHALPSLVTRTGWYASIPENCVAFVRPEREIEDIRLHLSRFLMNPAEFEAMGERGRSVLLRDHTPGQYADAVEGLVSCSLRYRAQAAAFALGSRVGDVLGSLRTEAAREYLTERTTDAICSFSVRTSEPLSAEPDGKERETTSQPAAGEGFRIELEYPIHPAPRYGFGKPSHPLLYELLDRDRETYRTWLDKITVFEPVFRTIPLLPAPEDPFSPFWQNGFIPGLDAVSLYGMIALNRPRLYVEIGSGNSTKFASRAIRDQRLSTRIISIDPFPRAEIDRLAHRVMREPLEIADLNFLADLRAGDIVFLDGSHRVFTNSDTTVFFLEILPRLKPGVLVQVHDICLPDDYPPAWNGRYYSEQYLLACYLLADGNRLRVVLPNHFICTHPELRLQVQAMWERIGIAGIEPHGGSFWMEMH